MGGLRWHAVRVGRLLRSTGGVSAESHRVQGRRFEEPRGSRVAEHRAGKQAGAGTRDAGTRGVAGSKRTPFQTCRVTIRLQSGALALIGCLYEVHTLVQKEYKRSSVRIDTQQKMSHKHTHNHKISHIPYGF